MDCNLCNGWLLEIQGWTAMDTEKIIYEILFMYTRGHYVLLLHFMLILFVKSSFPGSKGTPFRGCRGQTVLCLFGMQQ